MKFKGNLVIIGNGFDLSANLKSSYNDFYNQRFDSSLVDLLNAYKTKYDSVFNRQSSYKITPLTSIDFSGAVTSPNALRTLSVDRLGSEESIEKLHTLSFWDILFFYSQEDTGAEWNNIESRIESYLTNNESNCKQKYNALTFNRSFLRSHDISISSMLTALFYQLFPESRWIHFSNPVDFLLSELSILENAFSKFLNSSLKEADDYTNQSRLQFFDLFENLGSGSNLIINFNYTNPIGPTKHLNSAILSHLTHIKDETWLNLTKRIVHVHGSLIFNDIIFGIDSTNIKVNSDTYRFTKTYRQLVGNFSAGETDVSLPAPNTITRIVFFGHSLSELDYSYFQALFDYYNVYNSEIKLVFFYKVFDSSSEDIHRKSMVEKVTNLLDNYSKTLDNQGHAKNLIHKLLLEQRLQIKNIEKR